MTAVVVAGIGHWVILSRDPGCAGEALAALAGGADRTFTWTPGSQCATHRVILEAAAYRLADRLLRGAVPQADPAWRRVYGGMLRLRSVEEVAGGFHDQDESDPQTGDNPTFDGASFAERRRLRSEQKAREIARAKDLIGKTTIRAMRSKADQLIRLVEVPVVGLDGDGVERATGLVVASYPSYSVIQVDDNTETRQDVLFWYYRATPTTSIVVGVSPRMEA